MESSAAIARGKQFQRSRPQSLAMERLLYRSQIASLCNYREYRREDGPLSVHRVMD